MQDAPRQGIYPPWATIILSLTLLGVYLTPASFQQQLIFDRIAITEGEWFRLFTNHFVHDGSAHFYHNILPLLIGGLIYEGGQGVQRSFSVVGIIAFGCAASMTWIWWYAPEVMICMGLSDALYTAIVVIIFDQYRKTGYTWLLLIPLFFIVRIALQFEYGSYGVNVSSMYPPGHAVGLAAGFFWVFMAWIINSFKAPVRPITIV